MTPPYDVLEEARSLLETNFRHPDADHRKSRRIVERLADELAGLRSKVEALERERQPFKVMVDKACETGFGGAPHPEHSPAQREAYAQEIRAAAEATLELAKRLGFEPPKLVLKFQGEGPTRVVVELTPGLQREFDMYMTEGHVHSDVHDEHSAYGGVAMMREAPTLTVTLTGHQVGAKRVLEVSSFDSPAREFVELPEPSDGTEIEE